jgi:hypothetical protein
MNTIIKSNTITKSNMSSDGTSLSGYLLGPSYVVLVKALGQPTYSDPSGDDKVQKEWRFEYKGDVFIIYDWKTYDAEYTMNELIRWHIGSKAPVEEFAQELVNLIYKETGWETSVMLPSQSSPSIYPSLG